MTWQNQLYIRFRDKEGAHEIYRSPMFESPENLWESETLDNFVVDGDDESGFTINCDAEGSYGEHNKIIWLMFEGHDPKWVKNLMKVWKRVMNCELPPWAEWTKIDDLEEAYE